MKTTRASEPGMIEQSPFELLDTMQKQTILHATEPPQEKTAPATWRGIRFTLGSDDFVVNMDDINEVLPEPVATPLPGAKEWVRGVASLRGQLFTIIDLNQFLDISVQPQHTRHALVINSQDMNVGLVVDKAHGVMEFTAADFGSEIPEGTGAAVKPFTRGCYHKEKKFPVFSTSRLLNNQQFLAAAKE